MREYELCGGCGGEKDAEGWCARYCMDGGPLQPQVNFVGRESRKFGLSLGDFIAELEGHPADLLLPAGVANFRRWGDGTFAASIVETVTVEGMLAAARGCLQSRRAIDARDPALFRIVLVEAGTRWGDDDGERLTQRFLATLLRIANKLASGG